ncbi:YfdX family protein [Escherichia coli]|nr:YfdX family protein [Escherichia coli]
MKKNIVALIIGSCLVSGMAFANSTVKDMAGAQGNSVLTPSEIHSIENIAKVGNDAMQDVQLSRVAMFNGDIPNAKKFLLDADKKINNDAIDWKKFIKKNKKTPVDGDDYVVINATMTVNEDFQPTVEKTKAIKDANDKLKQGDKKGAIETLKLAGITVIENQFLMPLQHTRTDIKKAIKLFNEGQYYQSNLMLLSAEEGIIVDSESMHE